MCILSEAGAKRRISGTVFGGGTALFAAPSLTWLFRHAHERRSVVPGSQRELTRSSRQ